MRSIRILIADDHPLLRDGIRQLFSELEGFTVVGETDEGRTTVDEAIRLRPDIVVMDITMPGLDGIDATRAISEVLPSTRVLVLSMHGDRQYVIEALKAGAAGYVLKGSEGKELVEAVRKSMDGKRYVSPAVADDLLGALVGEEGKAPGPLEKLSAREKEVLGHIGEGLANGDIAAKLGISLSMVKKHKHRIMKKLDLRNTASLIRLAVEEGVSVESS